MELTKSSDLLEPSALRVSELRHDWYGNSTGVPVAFGFGIDSGHFHFRAARPAPALIHPSARPGCFVAELWKYDAAEFFLVHPETGTYLEFNLAPNGSWWTCLFCGPRERITPEDIPLPGVITSGVHTATGWEATASLPLDSLREQLGLGSRMGLNATFIVDSPRQRFFTATPLGPGQPDFHQPARFPVVEFG